MSNTSEIVNLLQYESLTEFPKNFLENGTFKTLDLSSLKHLKEFQPGFLKNCKNLKHIDLSMFSNQTIIPHDFLTGCTSLESINLSSFGNVVAIGNSFLENCENLKSIDLSPFTKLEYIGKSFLSNTGLTSIDVTPIANIKYIYVQFMCECKNLESIISTKPFPNLKIIMCSFLRNCEKLKIFSFVDFPNVKYIGTSVFANCSGLVEIDMTCFANVQYFIENVFRGCKSLKHINLNVMKNVTYIGSDFLMECASLEHIDLSICSKLTHYGNHSCGNYCDKFKLNTDAIKEVTPECEYFGDTKHRISTWGSNDTFMCYCTNLKSVDCSGLSSLVSIKGRFLTPSPQLKFVDLSHLVNIEHFGIYEFGGHQMTTIIVPNIENTNHKNFKNKILELVKNYCCVVLTKNEQLKFRTYLQNIDKINDEQFVKDLFVFLELEYDNNIDFGTQLETYRMKYTKTPTNGFLVQCHNVHDDEIQYNKLKSIPQERIVLLKNLDGLYEGIDYIEFKSKMITDKRIKKSDWKSNSDKTPKYNSDDLDKLYAMKLKCIYYFNTDQNVEHIW